MQNMIDRIGAGELDAEVACVVSSRAGAFGLERAKKHGIPGAAVPRKDFSDGEAFNAALWSEIRKYDVDLIVMAGFMSLIHVPDDFVNRMINVHPALIPSFCGKGMYGHHVHEAVLEYGAKVTGCTVHFVNEEYDNGPIIMQGTVAVLEDDTADSLAERVQEKERELYPKVIQLFAEGRIRVDGRRVHIAS